MASESDNLSTLSPRDKQVLKAISEGLLDPQAIAEAAGIKTETVISSAEGLLNEDLIQIEKYVDEVYSLTEEGSQYADEGLPERRLLNLVAEGLPLSEIKDPSLNIGIGWLRKKGWASVDKGIIRPLGEVSQGEDEKILDILRSGPKNGLEFDSRVLSDLKKRNLVTSTTSKSWKYKISPKAKDLEIFLSEDLVKEVGQITPDMIKSGVWNGSQVFYKGEHLRVRRYDVSLPSEKIYPGKVHPYQSIIQKIRSIMLEMGFIEIKGEMIQSSYWNFDALFQPQDHPAREMQDTFYLDSEADIPEYIKIKEMHEHGGDVDSIGWGGTWNPEVAKKEVLRTHTTALTIKYLADHPDPPAKVFSIDRAYRREAIDPTHTPEFEQLEGIVMDEGVTFSSLLGILEEFYAKMGFEEVRFRPAYFPYTEPSVEADVYIESLGWVELGGAGVFRREVTAPFGIDHPVLAWGQGVSRVAMLTLGLKDLRDLYQSDIGWLRDTPLSVRTL